jgi:hypothetical protein
LNIRLEICKAETLLAALSLEVASWTLALRMVLHLQRDRAARLGTAAHVVELEAHERLDERRLAVRLPADDDDRWRVDRHAGELGEEERKGVLA